MYPRDHVGIFLCFLLVVEVVIVVVVGFFTFAEDGGLAAEE